MYSSQYESYQQSIRAIYLHSIGAAVDTISPADSATLYNIATLCPYFGGPSVYEARALYSLVYPWPLPNLGCGSRSERMMHKPKTDTVNNAVQAIRLYPNPASDKLMLEWNSDSIESGVLSIENIMGETVQKTKVISNTGAQEIDISKIQDGTYLLWVKQNSHTVYEGKVVIIK